MLDEGPKDIFGWMSILKLPGHSLPTWMIGSGSGCHLRHLGFHVFFFLKLGLILMDTT